MLPGSDAVRLYRNEEHDEGLTCGEGRCCSDIFLIRCEEFDSTIEDVLLRRHVAEEISTIVSLFG